MEISFHLRKTREEAEKGLTFTQQETLSTVKTPKGDQFSFDLSVSLAG